MGPLLVKVRLPARGCPLAAQTRRFPGISVRHLETAHLEAGGFVEVLEVQGAGRHAFLEALQASPAFQGVEQVWEEGTRLICRVAMTSPCIRSALARNGWVPHDAEVRDGWETMGVLARDATDGRGLLQYLEKTHPGFELVRLAETDGLPHDLRDAKARCGLTQRQSEILQRAAAEGYFEPARTATAAQIAGQMGIDRSSFSRQLRGALRKLVAGLAD